MATAMTSKERCLAALNGQAVDRVPVFPLLMSFACRRLGLAYRRFATDGRAMAESQLNIRRQFPVDAITACSDAFRITADLGAEMIFPEETPPFAARPLVASEADLLRLGRPDPGDPKTRMADRALAVRLMTREVGAHCLVVGWVDLPFAEACSLCGVTEFMMMLADAPQLAHAVLEFVTPLVIDFARVQVEAGAPMIGGGDAAASLISPAQYREFALPYEQQVVASIHEAGARMKLHICGQTTHLLTDLLHTGADLFNIDHLVDFDVACRTFAAAGKCFKGNLNPVADLLRATPEECRERSRARLAQASGLRYMLSPGCEVPGETPDEVFQAFCEAPQQG